MHFTPFPLGMRLYFAAIAASMALVGMLAADLDLTHSAAEKAVWVAAVFVLVVALLYFPGNPFAK